MFRPRRGCQQPAHSVGLCPPAGRTPRSACMHMGVVDAARAVTSVFGVFLCGVYACPSFAEIETRPRLPGCECLVRSCLSCAARAIAVPCSSCMRVACCGQRARLCFCAVSAHAWHHLLSCLDRPCLWKLRLHYGFMFSAPTWGQHLWTPRWPSSCATWGRFGPFHALDACPFLSHIQRIQSL